MTDSQTNARVVVVDHDTRWRTALAANVGAVVARSSVRSIGRIGSAGRADPTVAVFGPSLADDDGLASIELYLRSHPQVVGILASEDVTTGLLRQAMRAGVADVVLVPDALPELGAAVHRAASRLDALETRDEPGPQQMDRPGKLIVVFGPKGGSGKSFVAANLAVALARSFAPPVALVDADLQFGDAAVMLKLSPEHTIADAVSAIDQLDPALTRSLLVRHPSSGLLLLPAPLEPAFADQISTEHVAQIIVAIRSFCSHVVVDTPAYFTDVVIGLLEQADEILLVTGMDVPNIKNVKLGLNTMRLLEIPDSKIKLVLNRTKSKAKMEVDDVERVLGREADALVPSDIVVPRSINEGRPAVISAPKSEVARSIEALARLVGVRDHRHAVADGWSSR